MGHWNPYEGLLVSGGNIPKKYMKRPTTGSQAPTEQLRGLLAYEALVGAADDGLVLWRQTRAGLEELRGPALGGSWYLSTSHNCTCTPLISPLECPNMAMSTVISTVIIA